MASLAAEWQKARSILDHQKNVWVNVILPKKRVKANMKNVVNNIFFDLYGYLDSDESAKTAEDLRDIQLDINELSSHLFLACHVSKVSVNVTSSKTTEYSSLAKKLTFIGLATTFGFDRQN